MACNKGGGFTFLARSLTRRPGAQKIVNALFEEKLNVLLEFQKKESITIWSSPILSPRLSLEFWPTASRATTNHATILWQITSFLVSFPHQQHEITITKASDSKDTTIQFKSCDSSHNSLFAFLPNHNLQRPFKHHNYNGNYEDDGVAVDWRSKATLITNPHRRMPNKFFFVTELHFGGCGCYTSSDRWYKLGFNGTAIGIRWKPLHFSFPTLN